MEKLNIEKLSEDLIQAMGRKTLNSVAEQIEISVVTLRKIIEKEDRGYNLDLLFRVCKFIGKSLSNYIETK